MGWLKRKKDVSPSAELMAERIARRILSVQHRFADQLNVRAKKVDPKVLKAMLVLAGFVFAGYCLWLITSGLFNLF